MLSYSFVYSFIYVLSVQGHGNKQKIHMICPWQAYILVKNEQEKINKSENLTSSSKSWFLVDICWLPFVKLMRRSWVFDSLLQTHRKELIRPLLSYFARYILLNEWINQPIDYIVGGKKQNKSTLSEMEVGSYKWLWMSLRKVILLHKYPPWTNRGNNCS